MKQKYTLVVANSEINIVTDEPKEDIDAIVGIVDRRIREIHLHSRSCSRTDAAILLCLDYCAEKLELQKAIKTANAQIERLAVLNEAAARENAALEREIEILRASLNMSSAKPSTKKVASEQLVFDDMSEEAPEERNENAVDKILVEEDEQIVEESLTPPEALDTAEPEKLHAKAKKKKVRAMFDMISFDDI